MNSTLPPQDLMSTGTPNLMGKGDDQNDLKTVTDKTWEESDFDTFNSGRRPGASESLSRRNGSPGGTRITLQAWL